MPENLSASVDRAEALKELLPEETSLPELALRFILSNDDVSTVIPGMRKQRHVRANVKAAESGALPASLIDTLRSHSITHCERCVPHHDPSALTRWVDRHVPK